MSGMEEGGFNYNILPISLKR
ncbi:hypothetical protein FOXB_05380 [Fusarium oxysporum f. sp. conglutinans Fo5176]|uniref:Uncharacterized protein n=1 Tax=Fusarium oxysporum (strain Fo5176) TaxID=660025 RepID=F9FG51_FUSOF|nr:hypothetical protein FOXB_05380 [Fusarium oxysporum f. sp. conglutinans Fo5176]